MQILRSILQIGSSGCRLTDEFGSESGVKLELMLGTAARLEFDLRGESETEDVQLPPLPIENIGNCANYFALDSSNGNSNTPALLKYSGITLDYDENGHAIFAVELTDNATAGIVENISDRTSADFRAEIGGLDADGRTIFAWQFDLSIRSRVFLGEADETVTNDPAYYTAVQTLAMLNARDTEITGKLTVQINDIFKNPEEYQFSANGSSDWHSDQQPEDKFYRKRLANIDAEWSGALKLPEAFAGANGKSAYEIAVDNGFDGSESAWLASLQGTPGTNGTDGANGTDGKSAYEIAVDNGFDGSESAWLASLQGTPGSNGTDGLNGVDGKDGTDGYTPVRGTDYWTDADKAEIKSYVDDAILNGEW